MIDQIDLAHARIVNAPDVRGWAKTAAITGVSFDGVTTRIYFSKQEGPNRWPDVIPPEWDGPLQYTIWLFRHVNGQWVGSAFVQMWHGRDGSGNRNDPDVPSLYDQHWFYSSRWAPLNGSGPIVPGEPIGFMVTSGNQRDSVGPDSVRERSNVVLVAATDVGDFTFAAPPVVEPPPVVVVEPPPVVIVPPIVTPIVPPIVPTQPRKKWWEWLELLWKRLM